MSFVTSFSPPVFSFLPRETDQGGENFKNTASIPDFSAYEFALQDSHLGFNSSATEFDGKSLGREIYPYWKERRLKRGGKVIIPQLDVCPPLLCVAINHNYQLISTTNLMNIIPTFVFVVEN